MATTGTRPLKQCTGPRWTHCGQPCVYCLKAAGLIIEPSALKDDE